MNNETKRALEYFNLNIYCSAASEQLPEDAQVWLEQIAV
jgi:hypothetical protein